MKFYRATWIDYSTKRRCYSPILLSYDIALRCIPRSGVESDVLGTEADNLDAAYASRDLIHPSERQSEG